MTLCGADRLVAIAAHEVDFSATGSRASVSMSTAGKSGVLARIWKLPRGSRTASPALSCIQSEDGVRSQQLPCATKWKRA